jgi:hypothetical protein
VKAVATVVGAARFVMENGKWQLPKVLVDFTDLAGGVFVSNRWCHETRHNKLLVGRCVRLLKDEGAVVCDR